MPAASTLMRFASAGRSAAATASRFARLAERAALSTKAVAVECHAPTLGSHRAASVDLRLHRPPVVVPPPAMTAPASQTLSYLKEQTPEGKVKFVAEEKDLESDETLWALYERWCEAFNQKRDHDEKVRRFSTFKKTVLHIHNKPNVGYRRGITQFADGKLRKPCCTDLLDRKIAEQVDGYNVEFVTDGSGKLYKRVYADYKVVQDRLYVHLPKGVDVKTITSNPEWAELEKYDSTNPEC
ncbi:hypothetical protein VPH35_110031 [Triticum aestivum]|uniref:Cathepsin propeptide inhibitor domain-containing protein n=2 Tax=cellular organisms TaxID=131567 RepID=A0A3B6PKM6_WHEAT|nr:uncharacterized protein LOC123136418 [Triticum aestivum]